MEMTVKELKAAIAETREELAETEEAFEAEYAQLTAEDAARFDAGEDVGGWCEYLFIEIESYKDTLEELETELARLTAVA